MIIYWLSFKHFYDVLVNTRRKDLFEVEVISLTSLSVESLNGLSGRWKNYEYGAIDKSIPKYSKKNLFHRNFIPHALAWEEHLVSWS